MLRYDFYRGLYLQSNKTIANVVVNDLDLNAQGQTLQTAILTNKRWKWKHYYCHQIGSSVFAIEWRHTNVGRHDFDLHFQVRNAKTVRASVSEKCSSMIF